MEPASTGEGARSENRLAHEASPYLQQHAHNPVDWFPWGEAAFAEARRRDVPIFLSVGYSTCYWCHVMERESFESPRIAALMNERFVCVKVDREQRPDVDDIYMAATQIMTGHGGWPMSVFLEPRTLKPFWCGTYFPAERRPGLGSMATFPQVLDGIATAWREQRAEVLEQGESLARAVREHLGGDAGEGHAPPLGVEVVQEAVGALLRMLDRTHGGFGGAPKFPQPVYLDLLLDVRDRAGDDATRAAIDQAIRHTLDRMAVGGMRDQVGGGFHRYSVDGHWTVPHFEKMLYDNAMLAEVYARAGAAYDSEFYRDVARTTIDYVLGEMTRRDDAGQPIAFFTAQDAEVDHREGLNYLWTPEEMRAALDPDPETPGQPGATPGDADLAIRVYGVDRGPNFKDPHHPGEAARNVLRMDLVPGEMAQRLGIAPEQFASRMRRINRALHAARLRRRQPHLDNKTILSWNALMVRALAVSGSLDGARSQDLGAAFRVARSLLERMRAPDGTLMRIARDDVVQTPAMLEDYAAMVRALVTLGGARDGAAGVPLSPAWADAQAGQLIAEAERLFGDGHGGFFDTREGATDLFVRTRAAYDGAMPAGPTLMALALAERAMRTRDPADLDRAVGAMRAMARPVQENPVGSIVGTRALLTLLREPGLSAGRLGFDSSGHLQRAGEVEAGVAPEGDGGRAGHATLPAALDFTPVEVFAPDERLAVPPGEPTELRLLIRIAPGFHVVAADPGEGAAGLGLVSFRVDVVDADAAGRAHPGNQPDSPVRAYADYPPGREFRPAQAVAGMRVYEGEFELLVVLDRAERPEAGTASPARSDTRPILVVTFQACNERECLRPQRLELDVAID